MPDTWLSKSMADARAASTREQERQAPTAWARQMEARAAERTAREPERPRESVRDMMQRQFREARERGPDIGRGR